MLLTCYILGSVLWAVIRAIQCCLTVPTYSVFSFYSLLLFILWANTWRWWWWTLHFLSELGHRLTEVLRDSHETMYLFQWVLFFSPVSHFSCFHGDLFGPFRPGLPPLQLTMFLTRLALDNKGYWSTFLNGRMPIFSFNQQCQSFDGLTDTSFFTGDRLASLSLAFMRSFSVPSDLD